MSDIWSRQTHTHTYLKEARAIKIAFTYDSRTHPIPTVQRIFQLRLNHRAFLLHYQHLCACACVCVCVCVCACACVCVCVYSDKDRRLFLLVSFLFLYVSFLLFTAHLSSALQSPIVSPPPSTPTSGHVCVCVREREKERERESVCVCECVCVCVCVSVCVWE